MRIDLKKMIATATSLAVAATLLAGVNIRSIKAEDNLLTGSWTHIHESYEANDALIANTRVTDTSDGFSANISITGWQMNWYGVDEMPDDAWPYGDGWCDNPYQLRSYTTINVEPKTTYELSFDIENQMKSASGNPSEKNVTVTVDSGIDGDTDNTFLFTTVRASANGTFKFDRKFTIPESYEGSSVMVEIAYGSYFYSYQVSSSSMIKLMPADVIQKYVFAPGTTENVNATGQLTFSNMSLVQIPYEEPTTEAPKVSSSTGGDTTVEDTTGGKTTNTVVEACTCNKSTAVTNTTDATKVTTPSATVEKPAKATIKSAKNLKGKKIKVTWKKVAGATKYQVRAVVGKNTVKKVTAKRNITLKSLKKNKTYKVSVRAYNSAGYGKWSKVKKVTIKK